MPNPPIIQQYTYEDNPTATRTYTFEDPYFGARDVHGKLVWTFDLNPERLLVPNDTAHNNSNRIDCGVGVERPGGRQVLNKVRLGVVAAQALLMSQKRQLQHESSPPSPRILCMVDTYEQGHDNLRAVAETWGRQCDGFFGASNLTDYTIGAIDLIHNGPEAYANMWQKIRSMWACAYQLFRDDYDFFYICGDDVYLVVDNLRAYLAGEQVRDLLNGTLDAFTVSNAKAARRKTERPRPLLLGMPHLYRQMHFPSGGGGYVLNRAALDWLSNMGLKAFLPNATDSREDLFLGSAF